MIQLGIDCAAMQETYVELRIVKAAKRVGIKNASQLSEVTGMSTNTTYDMWRGRSRRIDLTTLALLCETFDCAVQTILVKGCREVDATARSRPERTEKDKTPKKKRIIQL